MRRNMRARLYSDSSVVQLQNMKIQRGSLPPTFSQDNTTILQDPGYYAALYEFSQGSFPQTLWEYGTLITVSTNEFKLFIVNTPIVSAFSEFGTKTSNFISSFNGLSFMATYFQIFDIDARGFTRPLMFVIAHQRAEIISKVFTTYRSTIIKIVERLQKPSIDAFPKDLRKYGNSILLAQRKLGSNDLILSPKVKELERILQKFNITDLNPDEGEEKPTTYFTSIKFELRSASTIINLDGIRSELIELMQGLPKTSAGSNILCYSDYQISPNVIDFGGISFKAEINKFTKFAADSFENKNEYSCKLLQKLSKSHILPFIAFSLLSGTTLVIIYDDLESTKQLAMTLSIFCPFFRPEYLKITNTIDVTNAKKYSIVLSKEIQGDVKNAVSMIDLVKGVYNGKGCPSNSFVNHILADIEKLDIWDSNFNIQALSKLKTISSQFMFKMRNYSKISHNLDEFLSIFQSIGISKEDTPILKYWVYSFYNKTKLKPIISGNVASYWAMASF